MSGTSLDGLDLCAAEFECTGDRWNYRIHAFETITYRGTPWPERLSAAYADRGPVRDQVSRDFATWCQDQWLSFNARHHFAAHAVAHHGHTVEHDPSRGITVQIGHEASVFTSSPIPVVGDFRSGSVARGGQGAPLVPLADRDLFADFAVCVNLGGFSNASWTDAGGLRRAGDLGPCNGLLNPLASELGLDYDPEGQHAARGSAHPIRALEHLAYYATPFPKSLGREWMEREFWPVFNSARPPAHRRRLGHGLGTHRLVHRPRPQNGTCTARQGPTQRRRSPQRLPRAPTEPHRPRMGLDRGQKRHSRFQRIPRLRLSWAAAPAQRTKYPS